MSKQYLDDSRIHDRLPNGFAYANEQQTAQFEKTCHVYGARKVCLVRADAETIRQEADLLQSQGPDEFPRGYYESVAERSTANLALVLGPPKANSTLMRRAIIVRAFQEGDGPVEILPWYIAQYNAGFAAGKRGTDSAAWESGMTNHAWDDGYLDAAAGRPKWHLTHCEDHDTCGEG